MKTTKRLRRHEEGHFLKESPRYWQLYQPCYLLTGVVPFAGLIFFIFSWLRE